MREIDGKFHVEGDQASRRVGRVISSRLGLALLAGAALIVAAIYWSRHPGHSMPCHDGEVLVYDWTAPPESPTLKEPSSAWICIQP